MLMDGAGCSAVVRCEKVTSSPKRLVLVDEVTGWATTWVKARSGADMRCRDWIETHKEEGPQSRAMIPTSDERGKGKRES